MAFNSSRLPDSWCSLIFFPNVSESSSVYYQVTLTTCVVTSLLAPMAVMGNALIMATIWRNPSLRTPSYVLLAGLAFTDFCTGLLSQPFFVMYQLARLAENRKLFCVAGFLTDRDHRSLLTVRRVVNSLYHDCSFANSACRLFRVRSVQYK